MEDPTAERGRPVRVPAGLIVPIGPSGSGKTCLARRLVRRGLDPAGIIPAESLSVEQVRRHLDIKLRAGQTVYLDSQNLSRRARRELVAQAHAAGRPATALLASGLTFETLLDRAHLDESQSDAFLASAMTWRRLEPPVLAHEGFDRVERFGDRTEVVALPSGVDWRGVPGPFAVIGDVHGCHRTLLDLLDELGFDEELNHPDGLFPIFAGDTTDKGGLLADDVEDPREIGAVKVIRLVMAARAAGKAAAIYGNHERRLARKLVDGDLPIGDGAHATIEAIAAQPDADELAAMLITVLPTLPTHLWLDDDRDGLVAVHGGIRPELLGRNDKRAHNFCLYARDGWIERWTRPETVVFGHVIQTNGPLVTRAPSGALAVGIDTGAYEGGGLTAFRSDTRECVTVPTRPEERASDLLLERYRAEVTAIAQPA